MNEMDISIVLATYKRPEILHRTLESFSRLHTDGIAWEVLVVDNAGESATELEVKQWADKVPVHYLVERKNGKNNALNHAIPEIKGALVVLADDDILADPEWLQEIRRGAVRWPDHIVFGGRVLPDWPEGFEPPDLENPYLAGAYGIADWGTADCVIDADKVFGANMVVRREIFDQGWTFNSNVGPSAESTYKMGSETEFLLRLEKAGHQFIFLPGALVYHQIRPNQMSLDWLKGRAYRAGQSGVSLNHEEGEFPEWFGVPRFLLRMLLETWFKLVFSRVTTSRKRVEYAMQLQHLLGQISMHRKVTQK
jgi:glycosyltransferase involved in cell wall biosynthesis